jgi:cobalt-zinc-cadmium resistance protein CzcA
MLNKIICWSLENRVTVIVCAVLVIVAGSYSFSNMEMDAFPDTTPVQVQVNTIAPSFSALEVEQLITVPVEQAISGLLGLENVRSVSKLGLSQVSALFADGTDIYFARQLVMERLQAIELSPGITRPEMGPVATGLGEVYHYLVTGSGKTLEELTTYHDWIVKTRLRSVPGVAEVNTWGGELRQYHVRVDPMRLVKFGLTMDEIVSALQGNNLSVGGGYTVSGGEMHAVRGLALTTTVAEIGNIVIGAHNGSAVRIRDIGAVEIGHEIRRGAVTAHGEGEVVLGLGFMLMGANSYEVTEKLKAEMADIKKNLPEGISIETVYDRTELVDQVMKTVRANLMEGALLVISVLFIFLGNLRAGLIVACAIPLSMMFAFNLMMKAGIAGSLMSLGAVDFGLIVDSSVIMVENSVRHLAANTKNRSVIDVVKDAALEVRKPTMFGELIIMAVFIPILVLEGVEGRLFRPMALTMIFALSASMILSLTLIPVLSSYLLPKKISPHSDFTGRMLKRIYQPLLSRALKAKWVVVGMVVILLSGSGLLASKIGWEFIPKLSEMSLVINTVRLAGVSLDESVRYGSRIERLILEKYPDEVRRVWTRTGTAEVATDVMGIEVSDIFISLNPRSQWKRAASQEELTELMRGELSVLPGMKMIFTQPIEMRVNEMIAGIRADLGVKIFGDDLEILKAKSAEVEAVLKSMSGAEDIFTEQVTGQPVLEFTIDQQALSRYGIAAKDVLAFVEALGGRKVGEIIEQEKRFDLVVRLPEKFRQNHELLAGLIISAPDGRSLPLSSVASIREVSGPSTIFREWQKRRIVVQCNVAGRDLDGFVNEARQRIEAAVSLPKGFHVDYGGQFEHLSRARNRLMIAGPVALFLIMFFLHLSTGSVRNSLIIFTGAPFACVGGIAALWLRGMPLTISAAIGFIAVCGVSVLNGLVMVATFEQNKENRMDHYTAITEGALQRIRPVLMTALVAALGFIPMALNTGVGAEVQRPLATVVIGGVFSDTCLTLLTLPVLYFLFGKPKNS